MSQHNVEDTLRNKKRANLCCVEFVSTEKLRSQWQCASRCWQMFYANELPPRYKNSPPVPLLHPELNLKPNPAFSRTLQPLKSKIPPVTHIPIHIPKRDNADFAARFRPIQTQKNNIYLPTYPLGFCLRWEGESEERYGHDEILIEVAVWLLWGC